LTTPPIDPTLTAVRLSALLQQTFASRRASAKTKSSAGGASATRASVHRGRERLGHLASRIKAFDAGSLESKLQFTRLVIEAILVEEFGQAVVAEAAFQQLVDEVTDAVSTDAELGEDITRIVRACATMKS
jgi:hypothetical protein